ncbi:MAG: tetratricopeptide repeat-containing sensor histidine kinase [Bacteroidales bacterium]|nr:tetratricopeptide repeat-containing sensor histidine kinase [Bacteroidales bacterium]
MNIKKLILCICFIIIFVPFNWGQGKEIIWEDSLQSLLDQGKEHYQLKKYDSALPLFINAMHIADSIKNTDYLANSLNNIGLIYLRSKELRKSLEYFNQVLNIDIRENNLKGQASSYNNIANVYYSLNKLDSSIFFYRKSLIINANKKDTLSLAGSYNNIASVYYKINKLDSSYYFFTKSLNLLKHVNAKTQVADLEKNLAFLMIKMDNPIKAFKHIEESKKLALESKLTNILPELYLIEGAAYFALKQTDKGFEAIDRGESIRDSLKIRDTELKIEEQKAKLELHQSLKEKELIEKQSKTMSLMAITVTVLLLISMVSLFFVSKSRKKIKVFNSILQDRQKEIKEKNQQLTELNATKNRFIQIIAHDLKSPIGTLTSLTELLHTDFDYFNETKRKEIIKNLMILQNRTYGLLENLLDWSMLQQGSFTYLPQSFSIKKLTEEAIAPYFEKAQMKKVQIQILINQNHFVYADQNMTSTIIRNLTNNAIKYSLPGGMIKIHSEQMEDSIIIHVSDNGVGIPKNIQSDLFKIDKKIHTNGTQGEKGTGLGIIIIKDFIEKQGGEIGIKSIPNKGSDFFFSLPINKK